VASAKFAIKLDSKLLSATRTITNTIELIMKYKNQLNSDDELTFIQVKFGKYKSSATDNIKSLKKDDELCEKAIVRIDLILNKVDEIIIKQFN